MNYRVERLPAFRVIGVELRTTVDAEAEEVPPFWQRFLVNEVASRIPGRLDDELLGVTRDFGDGGYALVAGCRTSDAADPPEGMVSVAVPENDYARIGVAGPYPEALVEVWTWAREHLAGRSDTPDFEVYGERFRKKGEMDVYLALSPEHR